MCVNKDDKCFEDERDQTVDFLFNYKKFSWINCDVLQFFFLYFWINSKTKTKNTTFLFPLIPKYFWIKIFKEFFTKLTFILLKLLINHKGHKILEMDSNTIEVLPPYWTKFLGGADINYVKHNSGSSQKRLKFLQCLSEVSTNLY